MKSEKGDRNRNESTVADEIEGQKAGPPERPELSGRIGSTTPVTKWMLYQHTRAGKGDVGDVEALCDTLRGIDEYLPEQFGGLVKEVVRLLLEWNRVTSRLEKLEEDQRLVEEFESLKSNGVRTGEAHKKMANGPGRLSTEETVEKELARARKRLALPVSRWRRD